MDQSLVHVSEKAAKLENAQAAMSYRFTDPHILWEALQAASSGVHSAGNRVIIDGNKRLAMIGDAILKLVLLENSYARGDPRVRSSDIVGSVATNSNLTVVGREHGLDGCVNMHHSYASSGIVPPGTIAATVEAILGAVYLDGGIDAARGVMEVLKLRIT